MGLWALWGLLWGAMGLTLPPRCPPGAGVVGVLLQGPVGACGCCGSLGAVGAVGLGLSRGCYGVDPAPLRPPRSRRRGCAAARPGGGLWVLWVLWVWGSMGLWTLLALL